MAYRRTKAKHSRGRRAHSKKQRMTRRHKRAGTMKRKNRRVHKGGAGAVCGPVGPATHPGCNAGSSSAYVSTVFGDAVQQFKTAVGKMFA